jgi:hypothetical protein
MEVSRECTNVDNHTMDLKNNLKRMAPDQSRDSKVRRDNEEAVHASGAVRYLGMEIGLGHLGHSDDSGPGPTRTLTLH